MSPQDHEEFLRRLLGGEPEPEPTAAALEGVMEPGWYEREALKEVEDAQAKRAQEGTLQAMQLQALDAPGLGS